MTKLLQSEGIISSILDDNSFRKNSCWTPKQLHSVTEHKSKSYVVVVNCFSFSLESFEKEAKPLNSALLRYYDALSSENLSWWKISSTRSEDGTHIKRFFSYILFKMMSYENVHVGADVQVLRQGYLNPGKVRWKGKIPGTSGNWVGMELEHKIGSNSGIYKGIRYFQCTDGYGVFVRASQIRFPPTKGRSRNLYKTVSKASYVDESLFGTKRSQVDATNKPFKSAYIPQIYASDINTLTKEKPVVFQERAYFPLRHPIGGRARKSMDDNGRSLDVNKLFAFGREKDEISRSKHEISRRNSPSQLISSPSIPLIHNPSRRVEDMLVDSEL